MPLLYIAQAASANGIDLVSSGSSLGIQFSATSYRASLTMPIKQFTSNVFLLNVKQNKSLGSSLYPTSSVFLSLGIVGASLGSKLYAPASQFLASSIEVFPYPNRVYAGTDLFISPRVTVPVNAVSEFDGYPTPIVLASERSTVNAVAPSKGYATTITIMSAPKSFTLPMTMYA